MKIPVSRSPDNVEDLIKAVHTEIDKIKTDGVSEEDFTKITEALRLNAKEDLEYNGYWVSRIKEAYDYNLDL